MDRKQFIKLSCGGVAYSLFGGIGWLATGCKKQSMAGMNMGGITVKSGTFNNPLRLLQVIDAGSPISLKAAENKAEIIMDKVSRVKGYADGILAPLIRVNKGQNLVVNFSNQLEEETNIHWHGLIIPDAMDGHPRHTVAPGGSFTYQFTVSQQAGTNWFHPHPHLKTGRQVNKGLAGMLVVNDPQEAALSLPSGEFELPIIIQDKRIYADGSINYSPNSDEVMSGYFGEHICVNGSWSAFHSVKTKIYRVRILNGSNARVYNLSLSNGAAFYVIGSDGGLLPQAQAINQLLLSPGERADILIDFSKEAVGNAVFLQSDAFAGGDSQGCDAFKIMKFAVSEKVAETFVMPGTLAPLASLDASQSLKTRSFDISNAHSAMPAGMDMGNSDAIHKIGGKSFSMERVDETVAAGSIEVWEFDNSKGTDIHPMHLHGVHFQVLSRVGGRGVIAPHETGWKDTALCMPGEKVRIIMKFPDNPGLFAFHCHNLEHEDSGMMLNYKIA